MSYRVLQPLLVFMALLLGPGSVVAEFTQWGAVGRVSAPGHIFRNAEQPYLAENKPSNTFSTLNEAVLFFEAIDRSGLWRPIPNGPLLRVGDRHYQVPYLRTLLYLYGDLQSELVKTENIEQFDADLHDALLGFQQRHGVVADGIVGPKTRQLLNVPPWQRIDQLVLNINRQQTMQAQLGQTYIQINIPEYRLRLYDRGVELLDMKTIVGTRKRPTPVFSTVVQTLVVNPSWSVPKSIAFEDILPRWEKDNSYLGKRNLQVVSGWSQPRIIIPPEQIDITKMYQGAEYYRLWEAPGKNNTLGRLKFSIVNDEAIYLHDTRDRYLFESTARAFSSGCIRLENARSLADKLLEVSNRWAPQTLDPLFEGVETYNIRLQNPVPIHLTYWTAWLNKEGVLQFANDLYQLDAIDFARLLNEQQQVGMRED